MPRLVDPDDPPRRETEKPWGFWVHVAVVLIEPILVVLTRRRWGGRRHVPTSGGVILACSHLSLVDTIAMADFVLFGCGRVPRFLAKASLWKVPLVKQIFTGAHQIPVYRERSDGGGALSAAEERVNEGGCVVIYPEGTITRDPAKWPMRGRGGVARLALTTGAPVIPVGQWGQHRIRPGRRQVCETVCGPPVDLSPWAGVELTPQVLHAASEAIMRDITALVAGLRGEVPPAEPFVWVKPAKKRKAA